MSIGQLKFVGQLEVNRVDEAFSIVRSETRLLVDVLEMTGYTPQARESFVSHLSKRGDVTAVAVVTKKTLWRAMVGAMGLATRRSMRAFDNEADARGWLTSAADAKGRAPPA